MLATVYRRLYWTLVISFAVLGFCIAVTLPLFSVPDEGSHWISANLRVEGLLGDDDCVETTLVGLTFRGGHWLLPYQALKSTRTTCMQQERLIGGALTYPGVLISKLIVHRQQATTTRQLLGAMVARWVQGLLFLLCLARVGLLARGAQRSGLLVLGAFVLSPLLAQQAFGVSADGVQLSFGVCLFSALVFWERLRWPDVLLFLVTGWAATAKPFLLPCVLPSVIAGFWFARLREPSTPGPWAIVRSMFASLWPSRRPSPQTCALWSALLLSIVTALFALLAKQDGMAHPSVHNDQAVQLAALKSQPGLVVHLADILFPPPSQLPYYVGPLGWLDTHLDQGTVDRFTLLLEAAVGAELVFLVARAGRWRVPRLSHLKRVLGTLLPLLLGLCGSFVTLLVIVAVLYILWTPTGLDHVEGFQMRYLFGAVFVAIGTVSAALDAAFSPPGNENPTEPTPQVRSSPWQRLAAAIGLAAPVSVGTLMLLQVAHVFVQLCRRYY